MNILLQSLQNLVREILKPHIRMIVFYCRLISCQVIFIYHFCPQTQTILQSSNPLHMTTKILLFNLFIVLFRFPYHIKVAFHLASLWYGLFAVCIKEIDDLNITCILSYQGLLICITHYICLIFKNY